MWLFKFIVFAIPFFSLAWWIWADRRLKAMKVPGFWRVLFGILLTVLLGGFTWILIARNNGFSVPIPPSLYALVLLWGIIFLPLVGLPMMTGWAFWSLGKRLRKKKPVSELEPAPGNITRRQLLGTAAIALPVLATFGATGICLPQTRRFRIREMTVSLPDLPEALDGIRIAQVSDTHVGKFTRGRMLRDITDATNRLEADLVLLTGDLIDNSLDDLPSALEMVKGMDPRSGLFMIEGNHDLFDDPEQFVRRVRESGITLLRNEAETVQIRGHAVQIMGITWDHHVADMVARVNAVAKLRDPAAFPLLLAHHPHAFDAAAKHGLPLTLAGHTHGGQLMIGQELGVGPVMFKYWSGLYQKGTRSLVVSNGVGNWFPLRTCAPAEIVHLTLRKA
ncbi:MAG: metallophosphoesterase [Luteolibacter sp.]